MWRWQPRRAADGRLIGYRVGDPDPVMAAGTGGPVWFGGGTLARDLSLPKLQAAVGVRPGTAAAAAGGG